MKRTLIRLTTRVAMLCALSLIAGCGEENRRLQIGSQDFTEQKLLAEMMALLAEEQGLRVERAIPYGGNRKSLQAIQRGVLDAYPEYNGALLALNGEPALHDTEAATARARALLEPLGLRLLAPFGLENNFALAVRRDLAIRQDIATISDLSKLGTGLRFGVDEGYLERPVDGLYALARRYGLEIAEPALFPVGERNALYDALARGEVDVIEVFTTDSRLGDYGVVQLEDDLGFYAAYAPAPLVRASVLEARPELEAAWNRLAGRIDTDTMRELNGRVERSGEDYRDVAQRFLEQLDLVPAQPTQAEPRHSVRLAITPLADRGFLAIRGADALRAVMPARRVVVETVPVPVAAIRDGSARFGLVDAVELHRIGADGAVTRETETEAVGVVGTREAHLLTRPGAPAPTAWQQVAVGPEHSSSWNLAHLLKLAFGERFPAEIVSADTIEAARLLLAEGDVDAVLTMASRGHAGLLKLISEHGYRLVGLDAFGADNPALRFTFLRPARIPANTYPHQPEPVDTVAGQAVLAARVPPSEDPIGESGPGFVPGVFTRLPQRLPFETAARIDAALGWNEDVDPTLPASPGLMPETPPTRPRVVAEPASALLNGLAVAFLVSMILLLFRPLPARPALRAEDEAREDDRQ